MEYLREAEADRSVIDGVLDHVFAYNSQTAGRRLRRLRAADQPAVPGDGRAVVQRPGRRRPSSSLLLHDRQKDGRARRTFRRPTGVTATARDADCPVADSGPQRPVNHAARDAVEDHCARYHVRTLTIVWENTFLRCFRFKNAG